MDGAFYSFMSMNVGGGAQGTGSLTINAGNEGLDSELHLTINGGSISIFSDNDGINTNEDGVSVTTINGGNLHILAGLGAEGDGVDSNGWLVINGGTVVAMANPAADAGLDSDMGSYINGGTVVALGSTMDWAESDSAQVTMNLQFATAKDAGDAIVVTDEQGTVVFAYDPSEDEVAGARIRSFSGAILSCPAFEVGGTYQLFMGGAVTGEEVQGVYDAQTIAAYEDGVQQSFTGTDVQRGPGGRGGFGVGPAGDPGTLGERPAGDPGAGGLGAGGLGAGGLGERPAGDPGAGGLGGPQGQPGQQGQPGEMPERPEGAQPPNGEMPAGEAPEGEMPEPPEGFDPAIMGAFGGKDGTGRGAGAFDGEPPAGAQPSAGAEGADPRDMPGEPPADGFGAPGATGSDQNDADANTLFYAQDKVNNYSGIANADA